MLRITSTLILCLLAFSGLHAQETIDQRVLKNRGQQARQAFEHNRNSYNYYVFELDKSHWIADRSTMTKEEKASLQQAADFKNADNQVLTLEIASSPDFNFYDFGIRLQKDRRVCIALDKDHVLFFYKIPEISQLFANSDLNVK
jgi:hypothetical protein